MKAIPYQIPLYRRLAVDARIDFTAVFASTDGVVTPDESGYAMPVTWSGDHLSGYRHLFLKPRALDRGLNPDIVRVLLQERFDVLWVHGYNHPTLLMAVFVQRLLRKRVIFREEQTLIHPRSTATTLAKEIVLRIVFRRGPAMYLGTESKRWFEHYGVPSEQLSFAPYAVDNQTLARRASELRQDRQALRNRVGLGGHPGPVVITVSRLVATKQPGAIVEAFAAVRAKHQCTLLIVGTGELEEQLKAFVAREAVPDVVFAGFTNRDRIMEMYASADAFVLFSALHETWGVVVNEAMNFSLPVVVSDKCGCARDLVRDRVNGYIVDSDDVKGLALRLEALVLDPALRERLGAEARETVGAWNYEVAAEGVVRAVGLALADQR